MNDFDPDKFLRGLGIISGQRPSMSTVLAPEKGCTAEAEIKVRLHRMVIDLRYRGYRTSDATVIALRSVAMGLVDASVFETPREHGCCVRGYSLGDSGVRLPSETGGRWAHFDCYNRWRRVVKESVVIMFTKWGLDVPDVGQWPGERRSASDSQSNVQPQT